MLFLCNTSARYHANSFIDLSLWRETRHFDRLGSLIHLWIYATVLLWSPPIVDTPEFVTERNCNVADKWTNPYWLLKTKDQKHHLCLLFVWLIVSWSTSFCLIRNKIWFVTWDRKLVAFILLVELTFSCDLAYPFLWLTRLWIYYGIQGLLRFTK